MRPFLMLGAMPQGLVESLVAELSPIVHAKQPGNPALRALIGDPGVHWQYVTNPLPVPARPWTPLAERMRDLASHICGTVFDSASAFIYKAAGQTFPHSDWRLMTNVASDIIAITSYGATRTLRFSTDDGRDVESFDLEDGSLLVVPREYDLRHLHRVDPQPGAGLRVSLTFRSMRRAAH